MTIKPRVLSRPDANGNRTDITSSRKNLSLDNIKRLSDGKTVRNQTGSTSDKTSTATSKDKLIGAGDIQTTPKSKLGIIGGVIALILVVVLLFKR